MPNNPPAFPVKMNPYNSGMTLRDCFAAKAMQAIISNGSDVPFSNKEQTKGEAIAEQAYKVADYMLTHRTKDI